MDARLEGTPLRTSEIKMAPHPRGKRVWLQGAWLIGAAFPQGAPHTVEIDPIQRTMTIKLDAQGARKVAGKPERPIIDVIGSKVTEAFPGPTARVFVYPGLIFVEGSR